MENQEKNNINNENINNNVENGSSNILNVSVEETAKKVANKRDRRKKIVILLLSTIGVVSLLVALFIMFSRVSKFNQIVYNEDYSLYQYFSGVKISYTGKVTLTNEGDITTVESDEGVDNIKEAPIYFEDVNNEVLISKNMQLLIPRYIDKNYRLNYFSKIIYDNDSQTMYYQNGKNKVYLEDSFLYDGQDLYLFLMDVELVVGDKKYNLSPLSYVIVNYAGQVEIYDKKNDKYHMIELCPTDVIATHDDYSINLSTDSVSYGDTSRLLFKSVDNLELYKSSK